MNVDVPQKVFDIICHVQTRQYLFLPKIEFGFSYLDTFTEFAEFTEFYKANIVQNITCIWCCDRSSFSIGKLQRTLCSERKNSFVKL